MTTQDPSGLLERSTGAWEYLGRAALSVRGRLPTDCGIVRHSGEVAITRPDAHVSGDQRGGEQVGIDQTEALAVQSARLDEREDILGICSLNRTQLCEQPQHSTAVAESPQREFADDHGVGDDKTGVQEPRELLVPQMKVIDPDARIDEHARHEAMR